MQSSSHNLYFILCAIFITAFIIADIIGSKLIIVGPFDISFAWLPLFSIPKISIPTLLFSAGIISFPITFVLTDLINEFYGKQGARFITFVGLAMAIFAAALLFAARMIPASEHSPIPQDTFNLVFGLSGRMFLASLTAYMIGQLLDIQVFHILRHVTKEKMLWLRSTGSTVFSQLIDSVIVTFIAFSGKLPFPEISQVAVNNYGVKFIIAIALTPVCYLGHAVIYRLLKTPTTASHEREPV